MHERPCWSIHHSHILITIVKLNSTNLWHLKKQLKMKIFSSFHNFYPLVFISLDYERLSSTNIINEEFLLHESNWWFYGLCMCFWQRIVELEQAMLWKMQDHYFMAYKLCLLKSAKRTWIMLKAQKKVIFVWLPRSLDPLTACQLQQWPNKQYCILYKPTSFIKTRTKIRRYVNMRKIKYSQTCIKWPLLGPLKSGCLGQVVVL